MQGLSHVGLKSTSLGRSERFYTTVLGGEVVGRREEPDRRIWVMLAGVRLEIAEAPAWPPLDEQQRRALPALAFVVEADEVDPLVVRLVAAGVPHHGPYLKLAGSGVGVYFGDPDGNPLALSCASGYVRPGLIRNPAPTWAPQPYHWPIAAAPAR